MWRPCVQIVRRLFRDLERRAARHAGRSSLDPELCGNPAGSKTGRRFKQLTTGQKAEIARRAFPALKAEAKARQVQAGVEHGRGIASDQSTSSYRKPSRGAPRAADLAGELVGVSGSAVNRITRVAEERPDLHQKVKAGDADNGTIEVVNRRSANPAKEAQKMRSIHVETCPTCSQPVRSPILTVQRPNRPTTGDEMVCGSCGVPMEAMPETGGWYATTHVDPEYVDDYFSRSVEA